MWQAILKNKFAKILIICNDQPAAVVGETANFLISNTRRFIIDGENFMTACM